jgi:hypothetical protein
MKLKRNTQWTRRLSTKTSFSAPKSVRW